MVSRLRPTLVRFLCADPRRRLKCGHTARVAFLAHPSGHCDAHLDTISIAPRSPMSNLVMPHLQVQDGGSGCILQELIVR